MNDRSFGSPPRAFARHRGRRTPLPATDGGQALVEFALVLPVLVLILGAILQFGLIFTSQIGLTNGVREAARYASVLPVTSTQGASAVAPEVLARLAGAGNVAALPGSPDTFAAGSCPAPGSGGGLLGTYVHPYICSLGSPAQPGLVSASVGYCKYVNPSASVGSPTYSIRVTVAVTYNHPLFLPIVSAIIDALDGGTPGSYQLAAGESMRVENPPTLDANAVAGLTTVCP